MRTRVVVTGVGMITPLGHDRDTTWQAILEARRSGVFLSPEQQGPAWLGIENSPEWRGCPVDRTWRQTSEPLIDDALRAAEEAFSHAGLGECQPERTGCVVGASKGGLHGFVPAWSRSRELVHSPIECQRSLSDWPWTWPNAACVEIARRWNIQGPVLAPGAACATGLVSILRAVQLLQDGTCDVVIAGSSDASLTPALLACYRRLGVMARTGDPAMACRPFDRDRSGFLVGEGAGMLVLETREHARSRGARPLAEIVSGRIYSDGDGVTGLDETAGGLTRAIDESLRDAGISVSEIDLVSFHGTGTHQNDRSEATAWGQVLGAKSPRALGCAFKGGLGHLMGGAGSVETALTILAMQNQTVPPTTNLIQIDPQLQDLIRMPMTTQSPVRHRVRTVLKLSLGFGGPVGAIILRGPE